jgi:hypothetical protein
MPDFLLKLAQTDLSFWASRYSTADDDLIEKKVGPCVREKGFMTKDEFLTIARWKSPRSRKHCEANSDDYVRSVTHAALSTPNEEFRIRALTCLRGVDWPMASAILHLTHADPYPIMDWRAMWSLGVYDEYMASVFGPNTFEAWWWPYTLHCRGLARESGLTMRTVDRALWQYCKDNMKSL